MSVSSVSEPCTVRLPGKKGKPPTVSFPRLLSGDEPTSLAELRQQLYEQAWQHCESTIDDVAADGYRKTLDDVATFILNTAKSTDDASAFRLPRKEIPTALIFGGVNVTDHQQFYAGFTDRLAEHALVAALTPTACTTLKATMKSLVEQVVRAHAKDTAPMKLASHDMHTLHLWYQYALAPDSTGEKVPLVVLVDEYEAFDTTILSDLVLMMSEYGSKLPFVLVVGVSTSMDAVHQGLTKHVISRLQLAKFTVGSSGASLDAIFHNLFLTSRPGVRFSAGVVDFLLARFSHSNLSITEFKRAAKYALMDFYYGHPLSVLCCDGEIADKHTIEQLTSDHCDLIRATQSFRQHVDAQLHTLLSTVDRTEVLDEIEQLLTDDNALLSQLPQLLDKLHRYHIRFGTALLCLHSLQNQCRLTKRSLRFLFSMSLDKCIMTDEHVKLMMLLLRKLPGDMKSQATPLSDALHVVGIFEQRMQVDQAARQCHTEELAELKQIRSSLQQLHSDVTAEAARQEARKALRPGRSTDDEDDDGEDEEDDGQDADDTMAVRLRDTYFNTLMAGVGKSPRASPAGLRTPTQQVATPLPDLSTVNRKRALDILEAEHTSRSGRSTSTSKRVGAQLVAGLPSTPSRQSLPPLSLRARQAVVQLYEWIQAYLTRALQPYSTQVLHELVYYSRDAALHKVLTPRPRSAVQAALGHPNLYLHSDQALSPDTCILYRLYLECGRMINLYDWFEAFRCMLGEDGMTNGADTPPATPPPPAKKQRTAGRSPAKRKAAVATKSASKDSGDLIACKDGSRVSATLLARFIRSVAEMQLLGFIKPTTRKTDHVLRMTWGSV
ncbi:Origin recognition complex subunit 3 [Sorochytrium milnesiophthora]